MERMPRRGRLRASTCTCAPNHPVRTPAKWRSREPRAQPRGTSRTITAFDTGVLLPSAALSSGTSTFASG